MNENVFRTPEQEVSRLLEELSTVREQVRAMSATLSRLELRVRRAFPNLAKKTQTKAKASIQASLTPAQALELYDQVVDRVRHGAREEALQPFKQLSLPDLLVLHKELGLTIGRGKPSKKSVLNALTGRVKQSVMLTQHSNRERIQSG